MSTQQVQATIQVKSENLNQVLEESIADSSTADQASSYEALISANERLKTNVSKIFTEFVNKARLEQQSNSVETKRKIKRNHLFTCLKKKRFFHIDFCIDDEDDEEEEDADGNDEEEDAESSDNNEDEE